MHRIWSFGTVIYQKTINHPAWLLALSACTDYLFTAAIKPVQIGGNLPYHDQRRLKAKQKHLNTSMVQIEMPKRNQQLQTSESLIHFGHKHGRQAAMSLRAPSVRVSVSGVLFCFGEVKLRLWLFSFWVYFLGLLKVNSTIKIWFGSHCVSWLRVVFFFFLEIHAEPHHTFNGLL